jgi:hypothetical protein
LFGVNRTVITKHLINIFTTNELDEISVWAKIAHTAAQTINLFLCPYYPDCYQNKEHNLKNLNVFLKTDIF